MAGPRHGIIGEDYGTELPVTEVDTKSLTEEQKAGRYSKSREYKKLREHWESRITHYQQYLPDGRKLSEVSKQDRDDMWLVANLVIGELEHVMNYYEIAKESLNVEQ